MTDESVSAEPRAVGPLAARLDRPLTELTVDELMALKAEFEARGPGPNQENCKAARL